MKASLQLRASQHLALTPQLQQSIKLLQMSSLELQQELEQLLHANPMLERADDFLDHAVRLNASGSLLSNTSHTAGEPPVETSPVAESVTEGGGDDSANWDSSSDWSIEDGYRANTGNATASQDDEPSMPQVAEDLDLRGHLLEQLASLGLNQRDRALVQVLIEELDDNGYLTVSLEEVAAYLPAELEIDASELQAALHWLHRLDPIGVGARNVSECLTLQILAAVNAPHQSTPAEVIELALSLVKQPYLDLLAARDYNKIKRQLGCADSLLRSAQACIVALNPHPGASFTREVASYVVPDVVVKRTRDGWQAFLNTEVMPRLRVNQLYAQILKRQRGGAEGASGLQTQLQEAKWLIKNVQQRFDTILRVAQAIVERQRSFFSHGAVAMRPLVLREIADILGLHESTISRVTTQKYMLTPFGTFELKYFFGSHVATDAGGAASSTAIRALIKQLIASEDTKKPLSDSQLTDMLAEQGFVVARRTIAKYREVLKIPPVALRKSI